MWDREKTIKLIELYENYSVLWDVSSADYTNKHKKQNAYREIAEKLDKSDDEIKTKIHHLRTQFLQEVRRVKQKKSGQGTSDNYTSKWEFFDALKFIKNDDVPSTSKAKKRKRDEIEFKDEDLIIKKASALLDKPADDHQVFGDFVASELRLLKSHQNRLLLRRKIQRAILEVSEIDSEGTFTCSTPNIVDSSTNSPVLGFSDARQDSGTMLPTVLTGKRNMRKKHERMI
ncbi:uncharacterized protein LOC115626749 [Scaptodrosophila lebanonensis]|uniref:Uncharacterized protein LOC115626749 n=1 Tax=Drosophila lebanonensis TaxID=7225 RepID=A0A6J2TRC4_DROLE|nr:uncharacterized protein LOC115626749 [Scaptodrosophila lebanonensis]